MVTQTQRQNTITGTLTLGYEPALVLKASDMAEPQAGTIEQLLGRRRREVVPYLEHWTGEFFSFVARVIDESFESLGPYREDLKLLSRMLVFTRNEDTRELELVVNQDGSPRTQVTSANVGSRVLDRLLPLTRSNLQQMSDLQNFTPEQNQLWRQLAPNTRRGFEEISAVCSLAADPITGIKIAVWGTLTSYYGRLREGLESSFPEPQNYEGREEQYVAALRRYLAAITNQERKEARDQARKAIYLKLPAAREPSKTAAVLCYHGGDGRFFYLFRAFSQSFAKERGLVAPQQLLPEITPYLMPCEGFQVTQHDIQRLIASPATLILPLSGSIERMALFLPEEMWNKIRLPTRYRYGGHQHHKTTDENRKFAMARMRRYKIEYLKGRRDYRFASSNLVKWPHHLEVHFPGTFEVPPRASAENVPAFMGVAYDIKNYAIVWAVVDRDGDVIDKGRVSHEAHLDTHEKNAARASRSQKRGRASHLRSKHRREWRNQLDEITVRRVKELAGVASAYQALAGVQDINVPLESGNPEWNRMASVFNPTGLCVQLTTELKKQGLPVIQTRRAPIPISYYFGPWTYYRCSVCGGRNPQREEKEDDADNNQKPEHRKIRFWLANNRFLCGFCKDAGRRYEGDGALNAAIVVARELRRWYVK